MKDFRGDCLNFWLFIKKRCISVAKTASKKIGALIRSTKFLSPEVALYLYKSTIWPCMEYCCHAWAGAPSCYLEMLYKLQKKICTTVGSSLAASFEPLAHFRNIAGLRFFCKYYFGRWSSKLAQLMQLPYYRGRSTRYSDRLHDFSDTIPRCGKNVNSFLPRTARIWNSLPVECFPLTYKPNGFISRSGCSALHGVNPNKKNLLILFSTVKLKWDKFSQFIHKKIP